ncbi:MAG: Hsp20/alpha crystallin family protein [Rhizobacter sp.]
MFVFPAPVSVSRRAAASSRLLDQLFSERVTAPSAPASRTPALDVSETDTAYTLAFDVPGASRDLLKVSVLGRRVVLETATAAAAATAETEAAATTETPVDAPRVLYRERAEARYARTVVLPTEVDPASASAKFDNGVLTLSLSKKVPTGATQIAIG